MAGETERKDRREARAVAIALGVLVLVLVIAVVLAAPVLVEFNQTFLSPGVDAKMAAVLAFLATIVVLVIFAVAAGDGLLGEIQFMIGGFFSFFIVLWLLIAWIL